MMDRLHTDSVTQTSYNDGTPYVVVVNFISNSQIQLKQLNQSDQYFNYCSRPPQAHQAGGLYTASYWISNPNIL